MSIEGVIKSIISAGPDVNVVNAHGQGVLYSLLSTNKKEVVDIALPRLLINTADPNCGTKFPLIIPIKQCRLNALSLLLNSGAQVDMIDEAGDIALTALLRQVSNENGSRFS